MRNLFIVKVDETGTHFYHQHEVATTEWQYDYINLCLDYYKQDIEKMADEMFNADVIVEMEV